MLRYFRKWSIALKRRRLKKERDRLGRYAAIEQGVRSDGNRCHNCGAPLSGPFCHICGQKDDDLRRPIWTFFRELLDAIFDTDSKIIKTILLLVFMPGGLSRDFMEGKRARYLPPFRLYVVLLFVFFSTLSIADILIIDIHVQPKAETIAAREAFEAQVEAARKAAEEAAERAVEQAEAAREQLRAQQEEQGVAPNIPPIEPPDVGFDREALDRQLEEMQANIEQVANQAEAAGRISGLVGMLEGVAEGRSDDRDAVEDILQTLEEELAEAEAAGETVDFETFKSRGRELVNDPERPLEEGTRIALNALLNLDRDAITIGAGLEDDSDGVSFGDLPYDFEFDMFVSYDRLEREGIKQEDIDFILEDPNTPDIVKNATRSVMEGLRSPRVFNDLFNDWLPWALVILMPVFAGILRLTHWGKRRYYLNQLVFALHFHSFLFVMLTVFAFVVPRLGGGGAFAVFWWGMSLYLIIALKVGQQQGWLRAFFKAGFIWVSYFAIMMWTMAAVLFFGLSDASVGEFVEMIQNEGGVEIEQSSTPPTVSDQGD